MKRLWLGVLLLVSISLSAQHEITGSLRNERGEPIDFATVCLYSYSGTDSTMVQGVQTNLDGEFTLVKVKRGKYQLLLSSVGYVEQKVAINMTNKDLTLSPITLKEDIQALDELQVKGHAAEMTVKGDTLEYNTSAYKVGENAMVEDLLKKMSGVEVDTEGNVTVNGESITGIRIDGKKFFGDDVQAATKNIPAEMIEKIQVIDEKSDMAKLTGFEDDNTERIINLQLKSDRKKGLFGNFGGGLGADMVTDNGKWFDYNKNFFSEDFRYNANAFMNILLGESQTTVIGGANNTNSLRTGRGRGPFGGQNSGITWAENLGVNTNIAGKKGWLYGGDVQMTHSYNDTRTKSEKEQWSDEYTYNQNDTISKQSRTWDVKTRLEFDWTIDSLNTLLIKPEIAYTHSRTDQYKGYDYFRNNDSTTIGKQGNNGTTQDISAALKLIYSHKFLKPGRTLTLNGNVSFTNSLTDSHNFSDNRYLELGIDTTTNQWTDKTQNSLNYEIKASFVEPIYKTNHFIETALTFSQNNRWSEKNQYNDSLKTGLDAEYSNSMQNRYYSEALEVNYKWIEQYFDLTVGIKLNPSQTHNITEYGSGLKRDTMVSVFNFSPNASFKYKFGKKEFARIQYRGNSTQPTINQLEPVKDNSNSMNETVGNPGLLPSFGHTLRFMYSKYNEKHFSSIMTGIRGSFTKDALVNNSIYDQTGKLYQQTVNANGIPFSVNADLMYNAPFAKKMMQVHTRTSVGYSRRLAYIRKEMSAEDIDAMMMSGVWSLGDESRTGNLQAQEELTLRFTHDIVDIGAKGQFTYSYTHNNISTVSTRNVFNYSVTGDVTFHLPKSWEISTDIGYTNRIGYGDNLGDLSEVLWNATISKAWTNASIALSAYDMLNQKKNVVQTVGENYVQYQRYNTLPTYFMFTFTYKLNRMGSLKATGKAGKMQEMIEQNPTGMENKGRMMPPMGPPPGE